MGYEQQFLKMGFTELYVLKIACFGYFVLLYGKAKFSNDIERMLGSILMFILETWCSVYICIFSLVTDNVGNADFTLFNSSDW